MVIVLNLITIVGLVVSITVVHSTPYGRHDRNNISDLAVIDCSYANLQNQMLKEKIQYSCSEEKEEQILTEQKTFHNLHKLSTPVSEDPNTFQQSDSDAQEPLNFEHLPCGDQMGCRTSNSKSEKCGQNYKFEVALGICLPSFKPEVSFNRCLSGYLYSTEADDCILIEASQSSPSYSSSSSFMKDSNDDHQAARNEGRSRRATVITRKCSEEMIYSSEIDLCVSIHQTSKPRDGHLTGGPSGSKQKRSASASIVQDKSSLRLNGNYGELIGWSKCLVGQVYVSEVDLCL